MTPTPAPSTAKERIEVVDVVRGFAVLGILIANIHSWSGYKFLPYPELAQLPAHGWDGPLYAAFSFLVDAKFYAIFSMLFGLGFFLQYDPQRQNPAPFLRLYRRRLAFLLLFGVLHALVWSGDILTLYALLGFVLVSLRNLSHRALLTLIGCLLGFMIVQNLVVFLVSPGFGTVASLARKTYPDMSPEAVVHVFRTGGARELFELNLHNLYWRWWDLIPNGRIPRVLGLFLLGYYLGSIRFFSLYAHRPRLLGIFAVLGVGLTAAATAMGGSMARFPSQWSDLAYQATETVAQVTLALSYVCLLAMVYRSRLGQTLLKPLALVGRMAFSHYLGQTAAGILLFYGFAGGLFGTMGLLHLAGVVVGIYAFQVLVSSVWLRFLRFGPLEWVWRCLTHGKHFPLRRSASGGPADA